MSTLLNEVKTTLRNEKRDWKKRRAFFMENEADIAEVIAAVDWSVSTSARLDIDTDDVNLYVTGNAAALKALFHGFRKLGYEPSKRPGVKPESSFTTYFEQLNKPTFYLSFSSTLCKRVKVGTKTVEQDIYEVVCE